MLGLRLTWPEVPPKDSEELPAPPEALSTRLWCTVLLLRSGGRSVLSSCRCLEKKELFDAVMGVVGVFAMMRDGGGLRFLSECPCSCSAATLAAVVGLRGPTIRGGRLMPGGCFFVWALVFLSV